MFVYVTKLQSSELELDVCGVLYQRDHRHKKGSFPFFSNTIIILKILMDLVFLQNCFIHLYDRGKKFF